MIDFFNPLHCSEVAYVLPVRYDVPFFPDDAPTLIGTGLPNPPPNPK